MKKVVSLLLALLLCLGLAGCGSGAVAHKTVSGAPPWPEDSPLEFWITENVEDVDFSDYDEGAMFGGHMYLGKGYHTYRMEDGQGPMLPDIYVAYIVTRYPDYSSPGSAVVEIRITDPAVKLYGLTVDSSLEEWDAVMGEMGYDIRDPGAPGNSGIRHWAEKDGFLFSYGGGEISIRAEVTNKQRIIF